MKFSELKGRGVVSLDDATKIGEVEDLMVEPVSRHIVSLKVRTGLFSAAHLVPASDVKSVGADAVTLTTNSLRASTPAATKSAGPDSAASAPQSTSGANAAKTDRLRGGHGHSAARS